MICTNTIDAGFYFQLGRMAAEFVVVMGVLVASVAVMLLFALWLNKRK